MPKTVYEIARKGNVLTYFDGILLNIAVNSNVSFKTSEKTDTQTIVLVQRTKVQNSQGESKVNLDIFGISTRVFVIFGR